MDTPKPQDRPSKEEYYFNIALAVAMRSTCLRRKYGAVIVKDDHIISTGYNGSARGEKNCTDVGLCLREEQNIPHGERYELCRSVHAEANAIIAAPRETMLGAALYLACTDPKTGAPIGGTTCCQMCKRLVINAGIERVIVREDAERYTVYIVRDWVENDYSLGQIGY